VASEKIRFDLHHELDPAPSCSDLFPLTFRHFRMFGTCFCSKCGELNAFELAARLHLYWRLSKV
jgi:hypothetical protein